MSDTKQSGSKENSKKMKSKTATKVSNKAKIQKKKKKAKSKTSAADPKAASPSKASTKKSKAKKHKTGGAEPGATGESKLETVKETNANEEVEGEGDFIALFTSLNIETEVETEEMAPMTKKEAPKARVDLRAPEVRIRRASQQTEKIRFDASQVEILGYFLLSKREACLAPLYVGCVFRSIEGGKFYVKVRKMMYQIPFLLRFIGGSPQSGNQISHLDGTQSLQTPLSVE